MSANLVSEQRIQRNRSHRHDAASNRRLRNAEGGAARRKAEQSPGPASQGAITIASAAEWQAAMEALILVATSGGPTMFA
jgi:hypothetical protein